MRLSLSEISTVGASFSEDVAAYAAAGFDAIGLWEIKLPDDDEANRALLRDSRLGVANCVPAVPSILPLRLPGMVGPRDSAERVEALCASMPRLAAYEPESVLCLTGPAGDLGVSEARSIIVEGLREVAAAAGEAGVRLALEPIHPTQREAVSFVNSIADALALLADAGLDEVGLLADTYNLRDEAPLELAGVAGRVRGLHVADVPLELGRTDRVLPGEGGSHSAELAQALVSAGWDGSLDVEIFSTSELFWGLPAREAARRAHGAVAELRERLSA